MINSRNDKYNWKILLKFYQLLIRIALIRNYVNTKLRF